MCFDPPSTQQVKSVCIVDKFNIFKSNSGMLMCSFVAYNWVKSLSVGILLLNLARHSYTKAVLYYQQRYFKTTQKKTYSIWTYIHYIRMYFMLYLLWIRRWQQQKSLTTDKTYQL